MGRKRRLKGSSLHGNLAYPKVSVSHMIWRRDIGHYGGLYVDIPKEHYASFKALFPSSEFPRRVQRKSVSETLTAYGESEFHQRYPHSYREYYQVYFGDRSKGLERLERMI